MRRTNTRNLPKHKQQINLNKYMAKKIAAKTTKKRSTLKSSPQKAAKNKIPEMEIDINASLKFDYPNETLTLGLLQQEIDELLELQNLNQGNTEIEQNITKALAELLPNSEEIVQQTKHNNTIMITSLGNRATHSPYVLDLSSMIDKKRSTKEAKKSVWEKFRNIQPNFNLQNENIQPQTVTTSKLQTTEIKTESTFTKTSQNQKTVITNHEDTVIFTDHKKGETKHEDLEDQFTHKPWHYNFNLPLYWHRSLLAYFAICLVIILPIKVFGQYNEIKKSQEQIVTYANNAYEDLKVASSELVDNNTNQAQNRFNSAERNFAEASAELNTVSNSLKTIINLIPTDNPNIEDAENILSAGEQISSIGESLTKIFAQFKTEKTGYLTDNLATLQNEIKVILPKLNTLNSNLQNIRPEAIPDEKVELFQKIKEQINLVYSDLNEFNEFTDSLNYILGQNIKRRYLFVFQNNNELRPTGGFMGSFALVDIDRGQITNIEIPGGGTYDMQGNLFEKLVSPYPLHLINPLWQMQDANWFPDFPSSAKKTMWFYEHSGGSSVDGVIAINSSFLPKLLDLTGPIYLEDYQQYFTSANIVNELQNAIEIEYNNETENTPKKILGELAPKLIEKLFELKGNDLITLAKTVKNNLAEKEIQMYFRNEDVQNKISEYGWTGEILDSSKDYLAVINSNIGGGKTDAYIEQNINLTTDIYNNGEIINTVEITRKHTGKISDTFGQTSNLDYLRIYVPYGSQLISAQNFDDIPAEAFEKAETYWQDDTDLTNIQGDIWVDQNTGTFINNEYNKTVFGNWIQVDPGEEKTVIFKYRLPITLNFTENKKGFLLFDEKTQAGYHSLFWQKQAGQQNTTYNVKFNLPYEINSTWVYPENMAKEKNTLHSESKNKTDELFAFIIE